jgi:hypothetical protein
LIHADELLALVSVPPAAALDDLSDSSVVVSVPNKEFEVVAGRIWSGPIIFLVENTVQFLHHLDVYHLQKVRLFHLDHVNSNAVRLGHGNVEVL